VREGYSRSPDCAEFTGSISTPRSLIPTPPLAAGQINKWQGGIIASHQVRIPAHGEVDGGLLRTQGGLGGVTFLWTQTGSGRPTRFSPALQPAPIVGEAGSRFPPDFHSTGFGPPLPLRPRLRDQPDIRALLLGALSALVGRLEAVAGPVPCPVRPDTQWGRIWVW